MSYKGHYNQFFNCLSCNKRTDIMLDNCAYCGSSTPSDQKDYRRMRTRKLNTILLSKYDKYLNQLNQIYKQHPEIKIEFSKRSVIDEMKFKMNIYKARLKDMLDLY